MAYQGLFTQGPTVDDLLQKRNKRQQDMQQQLMNDAAQGARDPQRARMGSMFGSIIGRALGNNAGGTDTERAKLEARNLQQKEMQKEYSQALNLADPQKKLESATKLIDLGFIEFGSKLRTEALDDAKVIQGEEVKKAALLKQQQRREGLIAQATELGMTTQVELLKTGGNMDDASADIREQAQLRTLQVGNRDTRVLTATSFGKSPEYLKQIKAGKFDSVSDEMFLTSLKGKSAKVQNYQNQDGNSQLYRIDEQGKVWDNGTKQWVYPSELGLSAAPQQTEEVMNMFDSVTQALFTQDVNTYQELNTKANESLKGLDINKQSQQIFDEGIIAGAFANMRVSINKGLMATGMASAEAAAITANTETYKAYRGNAVAINIQAFGAGTGLSDADRDYAEAMAGGKIEMTNEAIAKILKIERKMYTLVIENNNKVVDRMVGRIGGTDADKTKLAQSYYLAVPNDVSNSVDTVNISGTWNPLLNNGNGGFE